MSSDTGSPYTRMVDGREVPEVGTWNIDPTHTSIEFVARHLMVTKVRGRFPEFSGKFVVADNPLDSELEVVVDLGSVDTGNEDRNNHLRSADFFEIDKHPNMTFRSVSFEQAGSVWRVNGELMIREESKPLSLDFEFLGVMVDPYGNAKGAFSAEAEIDRSDWGIDWNVPLEAGGVLVSKKIKLEIDGQAALETAEGSE